MPIHLPKPLHGWREFAGEVGIIVLGVLIALAFQEGVEELRWRADVRDAKAALRQELAVHYEAAVEHAVAAPCIDQQLIGLEKVLLAAGVYRPAPMYRDQLEYTYRAPSRNWPDDVWHSMLSEGVDTHLDRQLRLQLASHYASIDRQNVLRDQAQTIFLKMRILARPIQPDPATRIALAAELEQARGLYRFQALISNQMLAGIGEIGMAPERKTVLQDLSTSGTLNFCRAHHLALAKPQPQRPR